LASASVVSCVHLRLKVMMNAAKDLVFDQGQNRTANRRCSVTTNRRDRR
jgi:hypothetical protein